MILSVTFSVNIKCYGWFNVKVLNDNVDNDVEHIHVLHQLIFVEIFFIILFFFWGGGGVSN